MKRILILVAIALFSCSTASAGQGGGGEPTKKVTTKKKEVTKKKTSGTTSNNTTPPTRTPASPVPAGKWTPKGDEGSIIGAIVYDGTAPAAKKIDTSADSVCASQYPNLEAEDNAIKDGKVANVFVYIKDGATADGKKIGDFSFDTPSSEVTLDQSGCHYVPHVTGIQTNQKLKITNSDPTPHNIHFTPANNPEWNWSQVNGAPALTHDFRRTEVLVPVKCNQHPWMKAYIGVLNHPFFAVSKADGSYEIKGVPPGTYTVIAWREGRAKGTEQTIQVTVAAKGAAKADFSFGAATAEKENTSLEMIQALEVPMFNRP
jgi:hypothetical protein